MRVFPACGNALCLHDAACRAAPHAPSSRCAGQGGNAHVNEQPNSYVIDAMRTRNFAHDEGLSAQLREQASTYWFKKSLLVFRRVAPHTELFTTHVPGISQHVRPIHDGP
jgi:hypothetical protein